MALKDLKHEQALKKQGASQRKKKKALQVGQSVEVLSFKPTGYACWEGEWQGMVVQMGIIKMKNAVEDLSNRRGAQEAKQQECASHVFWIRPRGKRYEAMKDRSYIWMLRFLWTIHATIIHGRGTRAIQQVVYMLRSHRSA